MRNWGEINPVINQGMPAYCFYEKLPNSQVLGAFFHQIDRHTYNFAVVIGDSVKECEDWLDHGDTTFQTGNCGLKGLRTALQILQWFIQNRLIKGEEIYIYGEGKRGRAYKFLERFGFKEEEEEDGGKAYVYVH